MRRAKWTENEDKLLKEIFLTKRWQEIKAAFAEYTEGQILWHANKIGLKKDLEKVLKKSFFFTIKMMKKE
ncbi:hypothetical protein [Heyndrickxia acidicola]|uniref:Myb-like domain-containing protein n=1 Tax=Heyndrickxia acidicola TaxID=209389 RepID=A0ABU6MHD2_9BACI|nr:hypothetical protein [Heyndrickxia acidicola]MED1204079.1 hypothetical protein [Heyndrickxia acidicola]